jgi:outer membrane protein TolC
VAAALVLAALAGVPATHAFAQDAAPARGDLSVDQAVRLALERNKNVLSSAENVEVASGFKKQALQSYLPRLSAGASYSHNFNTTGFFDPNTQQFVAFGNDNYGVRYVLSQNILDVASLKTINAAGKDLAASKLDYEFSRADLALLAKQQYYQLLAAQELATVSDSALALSNRELQRTQSLFELGMVAKSDVLKAQVRVSQSQLDVIRDHGNVVDARARLANTHGQQPSDDLRASDPLTETPVNVDSTAIIADAIAHRADLQAAKKSWEAAQSRSGAAKIWFFPTVGGQIAYSNGNPSGLQPFSGFEDGTRSAVVGLNFPLFDGVVGNKGEAQAAEARAEQARYAYERLRLDIGVELRGAINTARQANEGLTVAKTGLESAEEDLKLSQEKYNVGSGTILDLLDAQVNLQRSRQQYVVALTAARIAEAQIERARGVIP